MRFSLPQLIRHGYANFETLACLYQQTKEYVLDSVQST